MEDSLVKYESRLVAVEKDSAHEAKFLMREIAHLRELRNGDQEALRLQAREYERRLDHLNGEHARAAKALELTVSREKFDEYTEGYASDKLNFWKRLDEIQEAQRRVVWLLASALFLFQLIMKFVPFKFGVGQ